MYIKIIFFCMIFINTAYEIVKYVISWSNRQKPLPAEVADVYEKDRYEQFISYKKDYIPVFVVNKIIEFTLEIVTIFFGFLPWIESLTSGNVYVIFFATFLSIFAMEKILSLPVDYYSTFKIEGKYGLNNKTKKEFFKDSLLSFIPEILIFSLIGVFIIFISENMSRWTNGYDITYFQSFLIVLAITAAAFLVVLIIQLVSVKMMRLQYTFTDMEHGELRGKIEALMVDSKKKVKHIKIYNESKKSNSKNAFLLRLYGYREFGIADNFITENSENELLAVLSHEVGHLKHKKNILNYMRYIILVIVLSFFVWLIPNMDMLPSLADAVNKEFSLQHTNYFLLITIAMTAISYITVLFRIFDNYRSRREEYEADRNAVKNGYGEELIRTFKQMSTDELIDVNPSPIIEFLDFDHPGMYRRIVAIRKAMEE